MRFSIILPTLDPGTGLDASLDSLQAQGDADWECLVMDGGSGDGTEARLARWRRIFGERLRVRVEPDSGVYAAMNAGIAMARGHYLYFLGAGDRLRPGVLRRVANGCSGRPELLYGDVYLVAAARRAGGEYPRARVAEAFMWHQGIFYQRELFQRFGRYDERYPVFADLAFNLRVAGDAGLPRHHLDLVVADYAGAGLSTFAKDPAIGRDLPSLARLSLGTAGEAACIDSGFALDLLLRGAPRLRLLVRAEEPERDDFCRSLQERADRYGTRLRLFHSAHEVPNPGGLDALVAATAGPLPAPPWPGCPVLRGTYTVVRSTLSRALQDSGPGGLWLFGAGTGGRRLCGQLRMTIRQLDLPVAVRGFFDNDPDKWGGTLLGLPVERPRPSRLGPHDRVVVATDFWLDARDGLFRAGFDPGRLLLGV
jgi:hypothetical protein